MRVFPLFSGRTTMSTHSTSFRLSGTPTAAEGGTLKAKPRDLPLPSPWNTFTINPHCIPRTRCTGKHCRISRVMPGGKTGTKCEPVCAPITSSRTHNNYTCRPADWAVSSGVEAGQSREQKLKVLVLPKQHMPATSCIPFLTMPCVDGVVTVERTIRSAKSFLSPFASLLTQRA